MSAFTALVRSALIGTNRDVAAIATGEPEVDALLASGASQDPEIALLRSAAIGAAIRRAATPPRTLRLLLEPAPEETLPRCGPLVSADLKTLLFGNFRFLTEWTEAAAAAGKRAPEETLPRLLELGEHHPEFRDALRAIVGARGKWLAQGRPDWAYAAGADDFRRAYEESSDVNARLFALASIRRTNPAEARALLESSWEKESVKDRVELLKALDTGIALEDEPFLDAASKSSRKELREAANVLLHRLPQSQAARRAIARGDAMLAYKSSIFKKELLVTLPEACTPEMIADGITPTTPTGSGERSWWLEQAIARVPVAHWLARFDLSLSDLIKYARKTDFPNQLLRGFAGAVASYRDRAAYRELMLAAAREPALAETYRFAHLFMPADRSDEPAVIEALRLRSAMALEYLKDADYAWSAELSAAALAYARTRMGLAENFAGFDERSKLLAVLPYRLDPYTPNVERGWPETFATEALANQFSEFLDTLAFRRAMLDHVKDGT